MNIPTNEELKKSLDRLKDAYNNKLTVDLTLHDYHIEINDLLDLASAYLEVSEKSPSKKEIKDAIVNNVYVKRGQHDIDTQREIDGVEEAVDELHDGFCLWLTKKLEGLEGVLKKLDMECSIVLVRQPNIVAESIRKHLVGGE